DRMLARDPRDRYQSASSLIVDLERSKLAALVPSFANEELALKDPVIRQRLTAPTERTQLDVNAIGRRAGVEDYRPDLWYLRVRTPDNKWIHSQETMYEILKQIKKGELTEKVEAYSQAEGKFRRMISFPEFKAAFQGKNGFANRKTDSG